jgi:hypothetical protein
VAIAEQVFAVIVNVWLPPFATVTPPLGEMLPPLPADAVITKLAGLSFAQYELQRLPFALVLSSFVLARVLPYSCSVQSERSSDGSTWALLKSPQRLRPVVVLKVLW